MPPHAIAVVAFDQISPFHLSVPCLVFSQLPLPEEARQAGAGNAREETAARSGVPSIAVTVCAAERGRLATTAGFTIDVAHGLEALDSAQTVIVPSWPDPSIAPPAALLAALRAAERRGARLVGLCLGAYVLAAAGLLDGRRATTHWAYAADFARRHPAVRVDADVLYVEDGRLLTSAGTAAGIDCCLHLLRQLGGAEHANHVARRLVVPPHRQGGQAQFVEQPLPASAGDARLAGLLDWARANLHLPLTLDGLAARALLSRRTFTRHFRQLTGRSVVDWLVAERLALTQRLLENTDQPVERIAALAGFGSPVSLRQAFRHAFGVSPSAWRQTFRGR